MRSPLFVFLAGWLLLWGSGCAPQPPAATAALPPSPTATAAATPTFTPSPSPTVTATATQRPTPTVTPEPLQPQAQPALRLVSLAMTDPRHGWALGTTTQEPARYHVLRTEDGGATWRVVTPAQAEPSPFPPVLLAWDARTAWVAFPVEGPDPQTLAQKAVVWRTTNRGQTWQAATIPLVEDTFRFDPLLTAADAQNLWLLNHMEGGMQRDYAALYASRDGGASWQRVTDPWAEGSQDLMLFYTTGLAFLPGGYGLATKENGVAEGAVIVETQDGGRTWQGRSFTLAPDAGICATYAPHLWGPQQATFLLRCLQGETERGYVAHMQGPGFTFFPLPEGAMVVRFFSPQEGVAYSDPAFQAGFRLYRTQDGGRTWQRVLAYEQPARAFFADAGHFWLLLNPEQPRLLRATWVDAAVQTEPLAPRFLGP